MFEAEIGLEEFVNGADDVRDNGLWGVEDATLDFEGFVIAVYLSLSSFLIFCISISNEAL